MRVNNARKMWLVEQVAIESRKHANGAGVSGEFGKLAELALARGLAFLDAGNNFDLLSQGEYERLHDALFAKERDAVDGLWNLLDHDEGEK